MIAREIGLLYAGAGEEVGRVLVTGYMIFIDNFVLSLNLQQSLCFLRRTSMDQSALRS